ncbi:MAG: DUF427 domain-containing protein [Proteobacteria bacterium]|nr:DUF427 domain-containing protein [Pseudomonadota bacterium]
MAKAIFNGSVIAESGAVEIVEGNTYFPPDAIDRSFFKDTEHTTFCGWKGTASYYSVTANGKTAENAAWTYKDPEPEAANIRDFVAFYPVVKIES